MNGPAQTWFVCGFGDVAAGLGVLAWDLGDPGALLLIDGKAQPATFSLEEGGDAAALEITAGDAAAEATLIPTTAELPLGGGVAGATVVVCTAEVTPEKGGRAHRCPGQISHWSSDPLEGAGTFRHLAVDAGDESLVVVESRGEPGDDHGDEQTGAWLIRGEEESRFQEAFVSTQYDGAEDPTRFGLELWPEEAERASRAAATRVAASSLGGARLGGARAGMFRAQTDGTLGLGSYLLWRR